MGTAISNSHTSRHDFTTHRDRLGVALTVLSLILFWLATPSAGPKRAGQPEIRIADLEHRVHELINKARGEHGLARLG